MNKKDLIEKLDKMGFIPIEELKKNEVAKSTLLEPLNALDLKIKKLPKIEDSITIERFKVRMATSYFKRIDHPEDNENDTNTLGISFLIIMYNEKSGFCNYVNGFFAFPSDSIFQISPEMRAANMLLESHFKEMSKIREFCYGKDSPLLKDTMYVARIESIETKDEDGKEIDKEEKNEIC